MARGTTGELSTGLAVGPSQQEDVAADLCASVLWGSEFRRQPIMEKQPERKLHPKILNFPALSPCTLNPRSYPQGRAIGFGSMRKDCEVQGGVVDDPRSETPVLISSIIGTGFGRGRMFYENNLEAVRGY